MYTLTPDTIAKVTSGKYIGNEKMREVHITGAVRDNRDVKLGNLFVCIQGERTDGHLYAKNAYKMGAFCCLTEKELTDVKGPYVLVESTLEAVKNLAEHHRKQYNIPVIGITGSVGKTTMKELIAAVLSMKPPVLKTEKNMNNELGVPLTLLSLNEKHKAAVIEMGISDFGEMSRLAKIVRPDIFIITNIGYSHTKELGNLVGVLRAKTEAFAYMEPDGTAILNGDDDLLFVYDPAVSKITFGLNEYNDYRAEGIGTRDIELIVMDIVSKKGRLPIEIPAYGTHLASLAPAAVATAHLLDYNDDEIIKGFTTYRNLDGRSNVSGINGITLIDDCYNANPGSMKAAFVSLSRLPYRRVAIIGDMLNLGKETNRLHREIGTYAAQQGIDVLLCHGEQALHIYEEFVNAADKSTIAKYYTHIEDLINEIPKIVLKNDAVLVKASRGMHFEKLLPILKGETTSPRKK